MRCSFCGTDNDRVIDSRAADDGYAIRRRRRCRECGRRFTTFERIEPVDLKVVKKDGVREPFDADKLRQGLAKACWKRPISDEQIAALVSEIERDIFTHFDTEVESSHLVRPGHGQAAGTGRGGLRALCERIPRVPRRA